MAAVPAKIDNSAIQLIEPGKPLLANIVSNNIIFKLGANALMFLMYQNRRLCSLSYNTCPNKANNAAELLACANANKIAPTIHQ